MPNPRILILEQRRNPPPKNRVRFKNTDDPQRPRVPRHPSPNVVVLDDVYDEKLIKKEDYYLPDEISKTVKMDKCVASMYICGEGDNNPNS